MESCQNSNSSERLWLVSVTYKNEEDQFKMESTRVVTTFLPLKVYGDFPDTQGQLTHQPNVQSGQISNQSEIFLVSLLSARMKKIQSKMKALEWSQHY